MKGMSRNFLWSGPVIIVFLSGILFSRAVNAQPACSQTLVLARNYSTEGRYFEIEGLLKDCLTDGFTKQERIDALQLLTLSYLYLDEDTKADSAYLLLLKTDPEHKVTAGVDPPDLVYLHRSFRTRPILNWIVSAGIDQQYPRIIHNYTVFGSSPKSSYKYVTGLDFGLGIERNVYKNIFITIESHYQSGLYTLNWSYPDFGVEGTLPHRLNWVNIPVYARYQFEMKKLKPYLSAGGVLNWLVGESVKNLNRTSAFGQPITQNDVNNNNKFNTLNYSLRVGAGVIYKTTGLASIALDLTYGLGLNDVIIENKRYVTPRDDTYQQSIINFGLIPPAFRADQVVLSLRYIRPIYHPKKLTSR